MTILLGVTAQGQTTTDISAEPLFPRPENLRVHAVAMLDTTVGVAVGAHGLVRRTSDGGLSWSATRIISVDNLVDVAVARGGVLVAVEDRGRFVRSIDSGRTWTVSDAYAPRLAALSFVGATGIAVGASDILGSTDGGLTWIPVESGLDVELRSVVLADGGRAMAAGRDGAAWPSACRSRSSR